MIYKKGKGLLFLTQSQSQRHEPEPENYYCSGSSQKFYLQLQLKTLIKNQQPHISRIQVNEFHLWSSRQQNRFIMSNPGISGMNTIR
jgi:hypothetical protein